MGQILDGKKIAADIQDDLRQRLDAWKQRGVTFNLTVVLVGDHPASASYVRSKQRTAEKIGMTGDIIHLPSDVTQDVLLAEVERLNQDDNVDGILVQLPLPQHMDEHVILEAIRPEKDVDGFHPMNAGRSFEGLPSILPCTPAGIMDMLRRSNISVEGKHAVVLGRSNIVGKPMALALLLANATVTICHSKTKDMSSFTRQADILVSAVGIPKLIGPADIKPGAVVIDVAMNRVDDKLVGDVDFEAVAPIASAITPVPGGVGPLTVATLMTNTVMLGERRRGLVAQ